MKTTLFCAHQDILKSIMTAAAVWFTWCVAQEQERTERLNEIHQSVRLSV